MKSYTPPARKVRPSGPLAPFSAVLSLSHTLLLLFLCAFMRARLVPFMTPCVCVHVCVYVCVCVFVRVCVSVCARLTIFPLFIPGPGRSPGTPLTFYMASFLRGRIASFLGVRFRTDLARMANRHTHTHTHARAHTRTRMHTHTHGHTNTTSPLFGEELNDD